MRDDTQWTLALTLTGPDGTRLGMALPIDNIHGMELARVAPPSLYRLAAVTRRADPMKEMVEIFRRREFRKDFFVDEGRRLGALLAERMEDAEGWHDTSRIEPAKRQLRGLE